MAKGRIKGITIEIDGDVTGLNKALESTTKELRSTQKQLNDVNRLLKLDPTNTELLSQKQRLLGDAIKSTQSKLETLKGVLDCTNEEIKKTMSQVVTTYVPTDNK